MNISRIFRVAAVAAPLCTGAAPLLADEPLLPPLPSSQADRLSQRDAVEVQDIVVEGCTAFSTGELAAVTAPYRGRRVSLAELLALRDELTKLYIRNGYVTSGVILPDQPASGGVITYRAIEGRLTEVRVSGGRSVSDDWIASRLHFAAGVPLNVGAVEQELQLLRRGPTIGNVQSTLRPAATLGEALLDVTVEDGDKAWFAGFGVNNHNSPSTGAWMGEAFFVNESLLGREDVLSVRFGHSLDDEGVTEFEASYGVPLTGADTRLSLGVERSSAVVITPPFDRLDIESRSLTFHVGLRQPLIRTAAEELAVGLVLRRRESETFLLGRRFGFAAGMDDGESTVNAATLTQEWVHRDAVQVFAASSAFTWGLPVFDATDNAAGPDGEFLIWQGQVQYVRRLPFLDSQAILRSSAQLSDSALLPSEKFSIGGASTVRGYRENLLSRDQGWVASAEWRVPTPLRLGLPYFSRTEEDGRVSVAAFFDYGRSWNHDGGTPSPHSIYSAGIGLLWRIDERSNAVLYLAEDLRDLPLPRDTDLQDHGIHFALTLVPF